MNISLCSGSLLSSSATAATSSHLRPTLRRRRGRALHGSPPVFAADSSGPIKGKNQFRGLLFNYGPKPVQVTFKTGDCKQQVIFIGGLTDGFLATEYLEPLVIALDQEKWSLVQVLLSSSYTGYGNSSLQQALEGRSGEPPRVQLCVDLKELSLE